MNNISINLDLTKIPEWFETKEYNEEFSDFKKTLNSINEFIRKFKDGIESPVYDDEYFNQIFLKKLECFKDKVSNKIKSDRSFYGKGGIFLYGEFGGAVFYKMVEAIDKLLQTESTNFRTCGLFSDGRQVKIITSVDEKVLNDLKSVFFDLDVDKVFEKLFDNFFTKAYQKERYVEWFKFNLGIIK